MTGVKFGTEDGTKGPLLRATEDGTKGPLLRAIFHVHRYNASPLRGQKPQNQPLSNLNTGVLRCAVIKTLPHEAFLFLQYLPGFSMSTHLLYRQSINS